MTQSTDSKTNYSNTNDTQIAAVAIVGGTHGNEWTGVYTVKHWQQNQLANAYPQLQVEFLLANPAAIENNKRYLEKDLNRCFKLSELEDTSANNKEQTLAKQINQRLGPKGNARVDFIIDLHTSTANMKTNIVLIKMDEFHLKLAAYLKSQIKDCIVTTESDLMDDHHFLCSIAEKGIVIEIGPIAQGSLDAGCFNKTHAAIKASLEFVELYNSRKVPPLGDYLEAMSYSAKLYFPVNEQGEISAMIHPNLIHQDYQLITDGSPLFQDFFGNEILYQGEDTRAAFINEAAYYDQKIAMCLCHPVKYSLTSLQLVSPES